MGTRRSGSMNIKNEIIIARIYRISNKVDNKVYIGSTLKTLVDRLSDHVYRYKHGNNMKLYKHFKLHGFSNFEMELLDYKIVKNIEEMRMIEQMWINKENPDNVLNLRSSSLLQIK